jgi:K+-sensing histidine kinase KdpD
VLVEAMGGRIWALPRSEGGSEFGFVLQRAEEDDDEGHVTVRTAATEARAD